MKVIFNKVIPFKGFSAINLFGVVFCRKEEQVYGETPYFKRMLNHEAIHTAQMKELGYIPFYILYFLEWLFRLVTPPWKSAYADISFEREAYENDRDYHYLEGRKHFAQWRKNK